MSNPVEGQDFLVEMTTTENLVDATVTIEYIKPDGVCVAGLTPTSVDTGTGEITYKLTDDITTPFGLWRIKARIVDASDDVHIQNPATDVEFDRDFCL